MGYRSCDIEVNLNTNRGYSYDFEIDSVHVNREDDMLYISIDIDEEEISDDIRRCEEKDYVIEQAELTAENFPIALESIYRESDIYAIKNNLNKHHIEILKKLIE